MRKESGDGHATIELSQGHCYYRVAGPDTGNPLLLIHGATVPGWVFDRLTPLLNQAGYQTYAPDLYGHGKSARPRVEYRHELFVSQIEEFIDRVGIQSPLVMMGHSLGAAVAARLVIKSPDAIKQLILAAPLVDFTRTTPLINLLKAPLLGELLVPLVIKPMLKYRRSFRYCDIEDGRWVDYFYEQLAIPGFDRALLSMVRENALGDQQDVYKTLQQLPHPVQVLRGVKDQFMSVDQSHWLKSNLSRAAFHEVENSQHAFILTHPDQVSAPILRFLKSNSVQNDQY